MGSSDAAARRKVRAARTVFLRACPGRRREYPESSVSIACFGRKSKSRNGAKKLDQLENSGNLKRLQACFLSFFPLCLKKNGKRGAQAVSSSVRERKLKRWLKLLLVLIALAVAYLAWLCPLRPAGAAAWVEARALGTFPPAPVKCSRAAALNAVEELALRDSRLRSLLEREAELPDALLRALANNPEMADFALGYPGTGEAAGGYTPEERSAPHPLLLQWDSRWGYVRYGSGPIGLTGCGPVCLSMAALQLLGEDAPTPDKMAQWAEETGYYVPGKGTAWAMFAEGVREWGMQGRELPLWESCLYQALDAGEVIICSMNEGDFTTEGHYIVICGYDETGFRVNDPNSRARSEVRWDYARLSEQISNLWALSAAE